MVCLADIAPRLCSRDPLDTSDTAVYSEQGTSPKPAWRRGAFSPTERPGDLGRNLYRWGT